MKFRSRLLFLLILLVIGSLTLAQDDYDVIWEVYAEYDVDELGTDNVQFINLLTGEMVTINVNGENYTPLGDYLLYFDPINRSVMTARPDGSTEPHPFIQLGSARRVDWVVSSDERLIAWTLTYDNNNGLTTVTTVANPSGTNQDLVLSDGPRSDGVRVLPVAFTVENSGIVLDSQPDGIGELAPYRQYANLFQLSLIDGSINPLLGEPSCFCAAAIRAGNLLRLDINANFNGYDVAIYNLLSGDLQTIPAAELDNYTQGGNILISPDGTQAVYALSQVEINSTEPTVRTIMMLVNLETFSQTQLSQVITSYLQPISWTEGNTAVLFTIPSRNGTWKIDLDEGELVRIASASFIGILET